MDRLIPVIISLAVIASAVVAADPVAAATDVHPDLVGVESFALALGDDLEGDVVGRLSPYDLVVVDGEYIEPADVAALQASGTIVLGYLSVGTIERYRSWYKAAKPFRMELWDDWGEWYADVNRAGFRRLITDRVAPMILAKGVDGLFLDNVDMIETHPDRSRHMRNLVGGLSDLVDAGGGLLFAQNGYDIMGPMFGYVDGWNQEDVSFTYDWDEDRYRAVPGADRRERLRALRRVGRKGIFTTSTDYMRAGAKVKITKAVTRSCNNGAVPWVADIELTRLAGPYPCS